MTDTDPLIFSSAMRHACNAARQWIGATSPNPPVGAVALDAAGTILAVAAHQRAGDDHAEAALLKLCHTQNLMSSLHTICVTLEPCNHVGRTPPCAETIIAAGIRRVVTGARDPNPHVEGGGHARLRQAGIEVIENVESEMCQQLIHAFAFHARTGRPFMTVKRAFDTHGSMIPPLGQKTFTSDTSLALAHRLRKKADALITGSGTILADKPLFTVRYVPDHALKRRILAILDRRHRVPISYREQATDRGWDVHVYETLDECIWDLNKRGVRDVLIEAGPQLSQSILESPYWTMSVDIHTDIGDSVQITFSPHSTFPFDINNLDIDLLLPLEKK